MSAAERLLDTDRIRSQAGRWQPGLRARLLLAFGGSATFIFCVAIIVHLFGLPVVGVNGELQRHRAEVEDFLSVLADRLADRLQQWLAFQRHQAGLASESLATAPAGDEAAALARLRPHLPEAASLLILDRQGRPLATNSRDARQTPALRAELVARAFASTQDETIDVDMVAGCPGPHLLVLRRFTRVGGDPRLLACAFHAHGELLTRPLAFECARLWLNVRIARGGHVQLEVEDQWGRPVKDWHLDEIPPITGPVDDVDHPVTFGPGPKTVMKIPPIGPVRFRFKMRNAQLFGWSLT